MSHSFSEEEIPQKRAQNIVSTLPFIFISLCGGNTATLLPFLGERDAFNAGSKEGWFVLEQVFCR
jgi:hypothetical protein